MTRAAAAAMVLLLAGCGAAGTWQKPGADADARSRDGRECRTEADRSLARARSIDADIAATRGADWERTGTVAVQQQQMEAHAGAGAAQVFAACMQARGYSRGG